jgi:hypothetical protein
VLWPNRRNRYETAFFSITYAVADNRFGFPKTAIQLRAI